MRTEKCLLSLQRQVQGLFQPVRHKAEILNVFLKRALTRVLHPYKRNTLELNVPQWHIALGLLS